MTSRVYSKARLVSMCGSGAVSAAGARSPAPSDLATAAAATVEGVGMGAGLEQAVVVRAESTSKARESLNHEGHEGPQRMALVKVLTGLMCFFVHPSMVLLSSNYVAFLSARFLRWLGCTIQAIPMLSTYRPSMGAAKMHIFTISGVGVMIAATMKIPMIE